MSGSAELERTVARFTPRGVGVLAAVLLLSAMLNLYGNTFPLGYHYDEPKKVRFVLTGEQDFHHPLLMLQIVRGINLIAGLTDEQQVVLLGRSTTALIGTLGVLCLFVLVRPNLGTRGALMTATMAAVCPTVVIHAHYFKEDVVLTTCLLLCLITFQHFLRRPDATSALFLGLATGLAASSHYKSVLLLPLYLIVPWLIPVEKRGRCALWSLPAAGMTVYVFLMINWPILDSPQTFLAGLQHEGNHAISGHNVRLPSKLGGIGFHWTESLMPGMTPPLAIAGLFGLCLVLVGWQHALPLDRLLVVYTLLFYFVPEFSPLKPYPGYVRYMLPVVPALAYFAWRGIECVSKVIAGTTAGPRLAVTAGLVLLALPLWDSIQLDRFLTRDTRAEAAKWLHAEGGRAVREIYAGTNWDRGTVAEVDVERARRQGTEYLVASSFTYDRYRLGATVEGQPASVYRRQRAYERLFQYPSVEFTPEYRSFAFSNPVIRIIDIRLPVGNVHDSSPPANEAVRN